MSSSTATAGHAAGTSDPDHLLLTRLRAHRRAHRRLGGLPHHPPSSPPPPTRGQRVADRVAAVVGSWAFILGQSLLIVLWISWNLLGAQPTWDPFPFILLNLVLSFQAAYTAPAIMMSQNRQAAKDRLAASLDYETNLRAELDILRLHEKLDGVILDRLAALEAKIDTLVKQS